jgi:hypothetical protein
MPFARSRKLARFAPPVTGQIRPPRGSGRTATSIRLDRLIMHYRRKTAERSLYPSVESFPGVRVRRALRPLYSHPASTAALRKDTSSLQPDRLLGQCIFGSTPAFFLAAPGI